MTLTLKPFCTFLYKPSFIGFLRLYQREDIYKIIFSDV